MNSKNEIVNALRGKFGTSVNKVFINSIGEEVGFREITVAEQKTLSRIMMDNENRRDIVYDAQCAVINKVCLNDKFDIYEMTEFDKIKLQLALYQSNVAKNDVTFTCEECGTENTYKMDFGKTISKLDDFDLKEKVFKFSDRLADYEFKIEFLNPVQFNTYEQDEGAINGWQKYSRCNFISATNSYKTIYSITRAFYTTREDMKTYKPKDGDKITFGLTVRNKVTCETREYIFTESLKLPYDIEK